MRRIVWALLAVSALFALAALLLRTPAVQDRVMAAAAERLAAPRGDALLGDDALRVLICGSASPLPHPSRARPCTAVFAGGRMYVVDIGPGAWNQLALMRVPAEAIGGVLLTHFHSDHIGELGEINLQTWVAGREAPLAVYGPPGVERVVAGFSEAYALDRGYRTAHHGADVMVPERGLMEAKPVTVAFAPVVVLEQDDLRITAFPVDHRPIVPSYGYRFDYRGRSVVVSGDTVKSDSLIAAARGADVLVHEAQSNAMVALLRGVMERAHRPRLAKVLGDIPDYHTTPVQAAEAANAADARLLVLTHLTPPPRNRLMDDVFLRGVSEVRPEGWVLARDGLLIELPAGSDTIVQRDLL